MAEIKKISTELQLLDKFLDTSGDAGTSGQVLTSTGTGINWVSAGTPGSGVYLPLAGGTMNNNASVNMNSGQLTSVDFVDFGIGQLNGESTSNLILKSLGDITYNVDSNNNGNSSHIFQESGSELMRIRYDGNVGIGTTNPSELLELKPGSGGDSKINMVNSSGVQKALIGYDNGNGGLINLYNEAGTRNVVVRGYGNSYFNGGNVGIGTTSPGYPLEVKSASPFVTTNSTGTGSSGFAMLVNAGSNGVGVIATDNGGSLTFDNGATGSAQSEKMRITNTGNVGIGTTAPSQKLHISGNMRLTGAFRDRLNSQGAANYVLTSTGSNGTQWVDASGSSIIGGPYLPLAGGTMTGVTQFNDHTQHGDQVSAKWGAGNDLTIQHNATNSAISNSAGNLYISNHADDKDIIFECDNGSGASVSYLTLDGSTTHAYFSNPGNVGIGTTSPEAKLTIKGDALNTNQPVRITNSVTDTHTGLFLNNTGSTVGEKYGMQFGGYNQYSIGGIFGVLDSVSGSTSGDITFDMCNGTSAGSLIERMRVTHEGNVGIGTYRPNEKLQVGGNIHIWDREGNTDGALYVTRGSTNTTFAKISSNGISYLNGGNVGIGTTSPGTALQVGGLDDGSNYDITVGWNAVSSQAVGTKRSALTFKTSQTGVNNEDIYKWDIAMVTAPATASSEPFGSDLAFLRSTRSSTSVDETTMILTQLGNVGIGTTSPDNKLDVVASDVNITPNAESSAVFRRNGNNYLTILSNASNEGGILFGNAVDDNDGSVSYKHNTQSMQFATADVERMRITSAGNVGIGTTAPTVKLEVAGNIGLKSDSAYLRFRNAAAADLGYITNSTTWGDSGSDFSIGASSSNLRFYTNNSSTERMRITSAGNVGIGTTNPTAGRKLDVHGDIELTEDLFIGAASSSRSEHKIKIGQNRSGNGYAYIDLIGDQAATSFYNLRIIRNNTGANATSQIIHKGTGNFSIDASDSADIILNPGTANVGIGTTSPGSKLTVVAPLSSGGIGTDFQIDGGSGFGMKTVQVEIPAYGDGLRFNSVAASSLDNSAITFYQDANKRGSIVVNATSTSYNTTSDYRLKENKEDISDAIERVKLLNPVKFNWISEPNKPKVDGFYAHELAEVVPEAVSGEKDALDYKNNPEYQSIDQSKIVPLLAAALQQAIDKIEILEQKIQLIENK